MNGIIIIVVVSTINPSIRNDSTGSKQSLSRGC